jgi:hypothetical protein
MDPTIYTRVAMAGWMFGAVVLGFLARTGTNHLWRDVNAFLASPERAQLVVAAAVGLAGLPIVGYLISSMVDFILNVAPDKRQWFPRNPWRHDKINEAFLRILEPQTGGRERGLRTAEDKRYAARVFFAFFYERAGDNVIQWRRRRRTNFHAAFNLGAGVLLGVLAAVVLSLWDSWGAFWWVAAVGTIVGTVCALYNAILEERRSREAILAWATIIGPLSVREYLEQGRVNHPIPHE